MVIEEIKEALRESKEEDPSAVAVIHWFFPPKDEAVAEYMIMPFKEYEEMYNNLPEAEKHAYMVFGTENIQ